MISYIIGIYIVWVLVGIAYLLKNLGRKHKPVWYINIIDYIVVTPAIPIIFLLSYIIMNKEIILDYIFISCLIVGIVGILLTAVFTSCN